VRGFTQDDAHLFCRPNQIEEEIIKVLDLILLILKSFGFNEYKVYLSTRPDKFVGSEENWEKATNALKQALEKSKLKYEIDPGEGVFYGPKIDIKIKDSLNRFWQVSTVQVDFNLPQRFDINYIEEDGQKYQPIMLHRALMGSLERFFGCLVEHYAGAFPLWLAPVQIILLPITDQNHEYSDEVFKKLTLSGFRVEKDLRNEKIGFKIRDAQIQKIPYMIVIGEKEQTNKILAVRKRRSKETITFTIDELTDKLSLEVSEKKLGESIQPI
jgi:threonyl-tRNA synthetase